MSNFWDFKLLPSFIRQNLASMAPDKNFWFFLNFFENRFFSIFFKKSIFEKIQKKLKNFIRSHRSEILSYEAGKELKISEIAHTFRLEANKSPYASLNMIKNTKHPVEKRKKKLFFPYLEKKIPLVKVLTQKILPKKSKFFQNFLSIENFCQNRVEWAP